MKPDQLAEKRAEAGKHLAAGAIVEAEAIYNEIIATDERNVHALMGLGDVARAGKDFPLAEQRYRQVATLHPRSTWPLFKLVELFGLQKRWDEGEAIARTAFELNASDFHTALAIGRLRRARGELAGALAAFEIASASNPKHVRARVEAGQVLVALGRPADAEVSFRAALDVAQGANDQLIVVRCLLALARKRSDNTQMFEWLQRAIELAPNDAALKAELIAQSQSPTPMVAAKAPPPALKKPKPAPEARAAIVELAMAHRDGSQFSETNHSDQPSARTAPDNVAHWVERAQECTDLGQWEAADGHLMRALELDPNHLQVLLQMAERLLSNGDEARGRELFARARKAHSNQPGPYLSEARSLGLCGLAEEACRVLAEGRTACGADAALFACEGDLLTEVGLVDRASDILDEGLRHHPRDMGLWNSRAALAVMLGDFDCADRLLLEAPAATPAELSRVQQICAQLAEARWQLETSIEHLTNALTLDPTNVVAAQQLAKRLLFSFDLGATRRCLNHLAKPSAAASRSSNLAPLQLEQIHEVFAAEPKLIGTLAALNKLATWSQITGLLNMARQHPKSTATALALAISLRRTGCFAHAISSSPPAPDVNSLIPRVIVQFWDSPLPPPDIQVMVEGWKAAHPDWRHVLYDDRSASAYLELNASAEAVKAFNIARDQTQRADLFRLARLNAEGGVYIDATGRCRAPLARLLPSDRSFVGYQEEYGSLGNDFLAVAPQHPIIKQAMDQVVEAIIRGDRACAWLSTGPGVLTRAFAIMLASKADKLEQTLQSVIVLNMHELRRAVVPHCKVTSQRSALPTSVPST